MQAHAFSAASSALHFNLPIGSATLPQQRAKHLRSTVNPLNNSLMRRASGSIIQSSTAWDSRATQLRAVLSTDAASPPSSSSTPNAKRSTLDSTQQKLLTASAANSATSKSQAPVLFAALRDNKPDTVASCIDQLSARFEKGEINAEAFVTELEARNLSNASGLRFAGLEAATAYGATEAIKVYVEKVNNLPSGISAEPNTLSPQALGKVYLSTLGGVRHYPTPISYIAPQ